MKQVRFSRTLALAAAALLLAACGQSGDDESTAADASGVALVTTVMPHRQTFHDEVSAWGSAQPDPQRARSISLAHGGQVTRVLVSVGQSVARGQALMVVAPDPAARAAYQQAQSALVLATGELQRTGQLAAQHLATQSQLATARKALADAQAMLAAQQALGGGAAAETVTAPDAGVVTALTAQLGERFAANTPLLGFMPAHALIATLGIEPGAGMALRAGMPVRVRAVYGAGQVYAAKLTLVGRTLDPQSHLLPAQAVLPAAAGADLAVGSALTAVVERDSYTAWAVPRAAVLQGAQGDYLFQLDHGKAHRVEVRLRHPAGDTVGVEGKLDAGLPVIVQGAYEVDDGAAVRQGHAGSKP